MKKNVVIIISGPTASGKTDLSLLLGREICDKFKREVSIVNFDSLLFYRELNVGTAKPSDFEMDEIKHELINICSAKNPINASNYVEAATKKINDLHQRGVIVLLVGGSGFYLRSLIKGMYETISSSEEIKTRIDQLYQKDGIDPFIEILRKDDDESYQRLHRNDHYRIMRAVEYFWTTGKKISFEYQRMEKNNPYDFSSGINKNWNLFHSHLDLSKNEHLEIIRKRTEKMVADGLIEEVRFLLDSGFSGMEKPLQSVGYKEVVDYFNGVYSSLDDCVERIIISTRQLAKAQRTWFKKVSNKHVYHPVKDRQKFIQDCIRNIFSES